ncbi:TetR family transcriptional regulator [Herbihabitans rhizosphaerae]|uniref:TetR family transcriptional regulator n=1 Tax=Herbihabitans rhizosphaerae TaxID=1872711 RepID=A0A4Q7KK41_9PSEU|nr:ScbR family autoregulator-binding transcription factor [Herbihabitans rhizosphaerae]RZS36577.1 TetR family transcriptional regulator [Herbihabitans rhizosphaerae]
MTKQARSEQTRALLLNAAADLLSKDGYAASSMEDISKAAGVTKGALYFHFSGKDKVCAAVQSEAVSILRTFIAELETGRTSALQSLIDLTHTMVRWLDTEPVIAASFRIGRECGSTDDSFLTFSRAWFAEVRRALRVAKKNQELSEDVRMDVAVVMVAVMCLGIEMLATTSSRPAKPSESLAGMWTLILPEIADDETLAGLDAFGSSNVDR